MTLEYIPFALPEIGEEEIQAVVNCMRSNWLTTGKNAKQFEQDFATYIGEDLQSVAINSASMGLLLVMEAYGIGAGDEVIIPTYTFSSTAMMAIHLGIKPVFADIDPSTLNIDASKIEELITPKTKGIVPVHFAGLACDMDKINAIAKKHNLIVIEDAAHSFPTKYKGNMIGNKTSHATVYSFYATKTITTGEGGMIVTNDEKIAARCRTMRLHGISRDVFDRYTAKGSKWYYEIVAPGYKCNLTDIAASIGIEQLKKAAGFRDRREHIANLYNDAFKDLPIILPPKATYDGLHAWHLYVVRLKKEAGMTRDEFIEQMDKKGVGCSVHFIPLHLHPYYQETYNLKRGDFPCAEEAYDAAVSLPIYTKMTDEQIQLIIDTVQNILQ